MSTPAISLSPEDQQALRTAYQNLEHPSFAARLTSVLGAPIEHVFKLMPKSWYERIHGATEYAIARLLDVAVASMDSNGQPRIHEQHHRILGMASGAVGGFFGLPALPLELPVSTGIMLRAIADIAHANGESLRDLDTRLACMEVFALGGRSKDDDAADTGYYGVRTYLALHFAAAARQINQYGLAGATPYTIRLIAEITTRFGVSVSEKAALQLVPLLGAAGGALVNAVFMQHFHDMAVGHFTLRRLERTYGAEAVRAEYQRCAL